MRLRQTPTQQTAGPFGPCDVRRMPLYRGQGLLVSATLHLAAIAGLIFASLRPDYHESDADRRARALLVVTESAQVDGSFEPRLLDGSDFLGVSDSTLKDRLEEQIAFADQRSEQENLERLDGLSARLSRVASESSIDRMADALQRVWGSSPRADPSRSLSCGMAFDTNTAQFHDIRREATPSGLWRYVCVLIDAQGHLFEIDMDDEDGRRLYETMQRIQQNPLLERVYRRIAMPLMDQMIRAASGGTTGQASAP